MKKSDYSHSTSLSCSSCATRAASKSKSLRLYLSCKRTETHSLHARCWFHFAHSWMRFWVADARKVTVSRRAAAAVAKSRREQDHPPVVCCAARAHKIQFIIEKFHRLLSWCAHGANAWRLWHCVCMRSEILMRLSSFAHSGCRRSALVTQSTSAPNSGRKCDDWFHRWCYSLIVLLVIYLLEAAVWQEITDFLHKMNQFRLPLFDIMAYLSLFLGSVNVLLYKKTKS